MTPSGSIDILWQSYAEGKKEVFGDIYLQYYPDLYAYGRSITSHTDVIDGAIQELFMSFWRKPPTDVSDINQYIFISFRNQLYRSLKSRRESFTTPMMDSHENISLERSAEDQVIEDESGHEIKLQINKALESLPPRRREAIFLKYFQNKSTREISIIMDIREEMVRNYIYKGIKYLRTHCSDQLLLILSVNVFLISLIIESI